jgi:two-component system, OmpR family, alkaline phosphatase synthesis response regulator PhoP
MMNVEDFKIIYAEDDIDAANLVKFSLEKEGFKLIHFPDGAGVTKAIQDEKPKLVLLDYSMPVKDGITVLREIKSIPEISHIPVVMITAVSKIEDVKTILDLGVVDYIIKPFSPHELAPRLRNIFKNINK